MTEKKRKRDLVTIATLTSKTSKQGRPYMIGTLGVAKVLLLQSEKPGEWSLVVGPEAIDKSAERV